LLFSNLKKAKDAILGVCPDNSAPKLCHCTEGSDTSVITLPIDNPRDLLACRPNSCECENGETIELSDVIRPQVPDFLREKFEEIRDKVGVGRFMSRASDSLQL
jgi:hypothetical protein